MKVNKVVILLLIALFVGFWTGYGLRMHHETKILTYWSTEAEKDLGNLEGEFHEAWESPRTFHIFKGQFQCWPVKGTKKGFGYKKYQQQTGKDN